MQSNVNTKELNGIALEIAKNIESLSTNINNFKNNASNIINQCEILESYNRQKVAGSTTIEKKYNEDGVYNRTIEKYQVWQINGQAELENNCDNVKKQLENIEETLMNLKLETADLEIIADAIDSYIQSIQEELGEDIDTGILASAFGTLSTSIAFDSYSASTGDFISPDHILTEYWVDKTLRFERNSDGTYIIYQKDANGNEVAMGHTTALAAALYMKKLKDLTTGNSPSSNQESSYESSGIASNNGYNSISNSSAYEEQGISSNTGSSYESSGTDSNNGYYNSTSNSSTYEEQGISSNTGSSYESSGTDSNNGYNSISNSSAYEEQGISSNTASSYESSGTDSNNGYYNATSNASTNGDQDLSSNQESSYESSGTDSNNGYYSATSNVIINEEPNKQQESLINDEDLFSSDDINFLIK